MQNTEPEKRESYAIDDDDVDIRLIQRQIANVMAQLPAGDNKTKSQNKNDNDTQETDSTEAAASGTTVIPPLLQGKTPRNQTGEKSQDDSLDVNEFMNMSNNEVSLDLLEQLTSRITAEMGTNEQTEEAPSPAENSEQTPDEEEIEAEINELDESEEHINRIEADEVQAEEATINQESEKTIVTDQICEYPVNNFDSEYMQTLDYLEGDKRYKKFVIYIDEENIDYISSLSIQERKDIINSILREQDDIRLAKREYERRKKLVVHLLIGIITFVICIPLLYAIVNTCLEATIDNYKRSQYNFEVLYKERGKIKSTQTQH